MKGNTATIDDDAVEVVACADCFYLADIFSIPARGTEAERGGNILPAHGHRDVHIRLTVDMHGFKGAGLNAHGLLSDRSTAV